MNEVEKPDIKKPKKKQEKEAISKSAKKKKAKKKKPKQRLEEKDSYQIPVSATTLITKAKLKPNISNEEIDKMKQILRALLKIEY